MIIGAARPFLQGCCCAFWRNKQSDRLAIICFQTTHTNHKWADIMYVYMRWYVVYVHASGHACVFLVFSCEYGSLAISIREISCWQAEPRSVPGPLTTLCLWDPWNVQECGFGQVERSSSETDTQTQPPPPPPPSSSPSFSPSTSLSSSTLQPVF